MEMSVDTKKHETTLVAVRPPRAEWVREQGAFAALEPEWNELWSHVEQQNTFLSFAWLSTWWRHFGEGSELAVITVRDGDGCLVGISPFYWATRGSAPGLKRLGFLGDRFVGSDYLGFLAREADVPELAVLSARLILREGPPWDVIELHDVREGCPGVRAFAREFTAAGAIETEAPAAICRNIALPGDMDTYLASIGSNLRGNYRRRSRNLEKAHSVAFETLGELEALERHFAEIAELHRKRFAALEKESAFTGDPRIAEFHRDALRALASAGVARQFRLLVNGTAVASLYGFKTRDVFQFYQFGMDPDWLEAGVGQITMGKSIEQAISMGCREFDFLRGDEEYKSKWANGERRTVHVRLTRKTLPAVLYSGTLVLKSKLKTLLKRTGRN